MIGTTISLQMLPRFREYLFCFYGLIIENRPEPPALLWSMARVAIPAALRMLISLWSTSPRASGQSRSPFLLDSSTRTEILRPVSYRFRLVSISCDPNFTFSIDSHNMTIIEVDGNNVEPLVVDSIQIFAGRSLLR